MGVRGPAGKPIDRDDPDYRPSRHDVRNNHPKAAGYPEPPETLAEPGRSLWFQICDHLHDNGLCGSIDSAGIGTCCRIYNALDSQLRLAADDPEDAKRVSAAARLSGEFRMWCQRFGMTPLDRMRIVVGNGKGHKEDDEDLLD